VDAASPSPPADGTCHGPKGCTHAPGPPHDGRRGWWSDAVFYQIFPDRFARSADAARRPGLEAWDAPPTLHGYKGGDLDGITQRLNWLSDLGITAVYLNPIFQSASNHRYHTHDYTKIDPLLGDDAAFDRFLAACRERGIRVVIDGVFNHASRGFFQFHDVLENGAQSPWADWFIIRNWPLHPYSSDKPANYESWWGLRALPKFNTDNPEVREFLMQIGERWARRGIDGWRLDVPEEIRTKGFWEEFRSRVRAINPDLYLVGEIWGDASDHIDRGDRFDGAMNYPFTTATIQFVVGKRVDHDTALENQFYDITSAVDACGYADAVEDLLARHTEHGNLGQLNLLDSHDTARILTIAQGDRPSVILSAVLLMTFPGAPSVYYGTEIGLPGGRDPDCRRAMPWSLRGAWDMELLESFRELIRLRHDHPALRSTSYRRIRPAREDSGTMLYVFERSAGDERIVVAVNAGEETEAASLTTVDNGGLSFERLWGTGTATVGEHHARLSVPPRSAGMWRMVR
jgi:cyclomaltodextrinase / maltogenic alpha-amylase / neopullulanase